MAREIENETHDVVNTGEASGAATPLPEYDASQQQTASALHDAEEREPKAPGLPSH